MLSAIDTDAVGALTSVRFMLTLFALCESEFGFESGLASDLGAKRNRHNLRPANLRIDAELAITSHFRAVQSPHSQLH